MKKVLIISYFFPPVNTMASKRYGTMCKYFEENGYIPYVLTTKYDVTMRRNIMLDCELPINKKNIIRIGSVRHNTEAVGLGWIMMSGLLNDWKYYSRTIEIGVMGWCNKVKSEIDLESLRDIDVIIGTFPQMVNLSVALYLSRKLRVPFIAEVRDLISDYSETPLGFKHAFLIDRIMERNILQRAAAIITVTSGYKNILKERYPPKDIGVIYNGWDGEPLHCLEEREIQTEKYLYYAGSFYLHRLKSFRLLVKCLKKINNYTTEKIKFFIRSIGPVELDAKAINIIHQEEMEDYVYVLPAAVEDVVRKEQEKAYINVVLSSLDSEDKALMTTVPGKIYELLRQNPPVLAIVFGHSDIAKVLDYTNKGIASVNEKEIVDFIVDKNKKYMGNYKINFFSRRTQTERLCKFMDQLLVE
ncbi:hypothetical protein D3Z51_03810 [Clostridiaceae bacterium]|nr:hypothetical protein [Clostridiaceae bacterium]RKI16905.1 hypothetical protein D7V81_04090 [bacterium 1XD21-70]